MANSDTAITGLVSFRKAGLLSPRQQAVRSWQRYAPGPLGVVLCTALLLVIQWTPRLDTVALVYLSVVVGAAFLGGLGPGVTTALVAFLFMNVFFLPPVGGLTF